MTQKIHTVDLEAYDIFQKSIIVQGYYLEEPIFELQITDSIEANQEYM